MNSLFDITRFMPHGHCFQWDPAILWPSVFSDTLIAVSYMAIPFTLVFQIMRKRADLPFTWMFLCFGAFIIACGSTHIMDVIVTWGATLRTGRSDQGHYRACFRADGDHSLPPKIVQLPTAQQIVQEQTLRLRAEAANEAKDRFIAMLSHELRTPLTPVRAGLQIVEDELRKLNRTPETKAAQDALQMIRQNVEMEKLLIDDLLDLSGLKHGKLGLSQGPVELGRVCRDGVAQVEAAFAQKRVALTLELAAEVTVVMGDKVRLHQI